MGVLYGFSVCTGYTYADQVDACVRTRRVSLSECSRGRPVLFYPHYYSVGDRALIRGRSTARQGKPRREPRLFMDGFPFNFRQDRSVSLYRSASLRPDPLSYPPFVHAPVQPFRDRFNAVPPTRLIRFSSSLWDSRGAIRASPRISEHLLANNAPALIYFGYRCSLSSPFESRSEIFPPILEISRSERRSAIDPSTRARSVRCTLFHGPEENFRVTVYTRSCRRIRTNESFHLARFFGLGFRRGMPTRGAAERPR